MNGTEGQYQVEALPLPGNHRVFAAVRPGDKAKFVIKRPRAGYPPAEEVAALRHEFAVLSRLQGTPVTEVHDFIEDPLAGLVLGVAPGQSLDRLIAAGRPDVTLFSSLAVAIARTLAEVHARGFVHRDVKPHHFFIDDTTGQARLIDFGLATRLPRERRLPSEPDAIQGTLAYISPEQTGRTNHSVDQRTDLYSLGVTLYELWSGERPFNSDEALELIHAHIAQKPAPLSLRRPGLPATLEEIVLRLLAKSPEERYQTAAGLLADLERSREELLRTGSLVPFALGQHDYDGALRVPEKLYGRAAPRAALLEAVRGAQSGARALALVIGPPGVGKSALVHEVHREIARGSHFVAGKFDQYNRGIPYSALATACSELVRVYLAATARELDAWRNRLRVALGDNARVIADVVPELVLALGEQPELSPLPPNEAQTRFERTFRRFMEASACEEAPLVLFLDDLQWADTASLAILELVLSSDNQHHLLVIGSYRDSEVDSSHPLSLLLARLQRRVQVQQIGLEPLARSDVHELVSDALRLTQRDGEALASLIFDKTSGNPFFVGQFLERLADEGYLEFETGRGYTWDLAAIAALGATANVVDLVVARLGALEPRTQELLRLAACIGYTFRLDTLAVIAEDEPGAVLRALLPALMGGYVVPLAQNHRLLEDLPDAPPALISEVRYRFVHDRVQQAALATSDTTALARVHLRIGRLLLSLAGDAGPSDEQLFEVVTQLNQGRSELQDPEEQRRVARLNLRTALRARSAAARASAAELAEICLELLGQSPTAADRETSLSAHFVAAESYYLLHDESSALRHIDAIERSAERALDRVPARNLKATIVTNQGRPQEATAISLQTLAELGMHLPDARDPAALGAAIGEAFGAYQLALGSREIASLYDLPAMTDPEQLALVSALAGAIPSVFQWNPSLMVLLVLRAVRLAPEYGTAPIAPFFYAQYGIVHHVITGDAVRAHEFGLLALALVERAEYAAARGGVEFIYAEFLAPWVRPRLESALHFKRGVSFGLDAGDQLHAGYCMAVGVAEALYAGRALTELQAEIPGSLKALTEQGDVLNQLLLEIVNRGLACLRGETAAPGSLDDEQFSEQHFEANGPPPVKAHYGAIKAMLRFLFGHAAEARRVTEAIAPPPGVVFKVDYVFYHGMACAELARSAEPEERAALLLQADADLACFEPWTRVARGNFFAQQELLRAELHAVRGDTGSALDAFDRAIEASLEAGTTHHLALAHERAGRFQLRLGRQRLALLSLEAAARQYERWGATGKLRQLSEEFPNLRERETARQYANSGQAAVSSSGGGSRLDLQSAMRAVNAIASQIRLEPLLRRLTEILVQNAGATRGLVLLAEHGEFVVRAAVRVQGEQALLEPDDQLEAGQALALSVVRYCARTLGSVVLDNAGRDNRFAQDPFIEGRAMKSIACVPLVHQRELVGVLYLENDTATGAFHAARVERLEFLAGHAAVALQNARLYAELQASNQNLEQRVRERTAELTERNGDMRRVLDNVKQGLLTLDLEGRLAAERSHVVDAWLGTFEPNTPFTSYLAPIDARFAEHFGLAFEQLVEGALSEQLLLDQLPTALTDGERQLHLSYEAIHTQGKLSGLLVVIDDVTEVRRRAREEAEQKDVLALCRQLSQDRGALLSFIDEAHGLVCDLTSCSQLDAALKRTLHTLKGNASMLGFLTLAEYCDTAESAIADGTFQVSHLQAIADHFALLRGTLASTAGENAGERIEVSRATLRSVAQRIAAGLPANEAARAVERLLLEPVRPSFERLGNYARALASRLGKPKPRIEIADGGLLVDAKRAAPLLASLVHLIRNAVDHGFETGAEHAASGKQESLLSLSAHIEHGEVVIAIHDNGRGIDWERVRERAHTHGLPAHSKQDLVAALLSAEFSTRDQASSISGRGVGLAAVQAEVTRMSGRMTIQSEPGRGTLFRLFVAPDAFGVPRDGSQMPPALRSL